MRIRAAVLEATGGPHRVQELDLAPPGAQEVLVRLHASGVCHSDFNAIDGTAETRCPAVLGHEGAGVVEAVGADVRRVGVGDHVALSWAPSCGECAECRRDLPQLCSTAWPAMATGGLMDGTTRLSRGGEPVYHYSFLSTFAEASVVPERCCVPIARDVPFDVAGLVGCAVTTGVGAVWRTAGVRPGDRVAVIGCGGVGLSALMAAVAVGAEPVIAVDAEPGKLEVARSFGATGGVLWAGSAEETAEAVREATGGGVDYAIEATGRPEAMVTAFLSTRARGAAVLIGIPRADAVLQLPALSIPRLERRILGSIYGSSRPERDFAQTLDLYRRGRLPLDRLVSHRLPLDCCRGGLRPDALGRSPPRRPRPHHLGGARWISNTWTAGSAKAGEARPRTAATSTSCSPAGGARRRRRRSACSRTRRPGHTPVLCCVGPSQQEYEPIWPPTLMMNKATALEDRHQTITWGATQLGIGQGVLDAVADGLIEATGELIVLVAVWIDSRADDETAVRVAARAATRKALGVCVEGRDPKAAARLVAERDALTNPFYAGR